MTERITVDMTVEQAQAIVDAVNCMSFAAEGDLDQLRDAYFPRHTEDSDFTDQYMRMQAEFAEEVSDMLRPEIDAVNCRDPELQEAMHLVKMSVKYGLFDD